MGLFAFRRMRDREAISQEVASFSMPIMKSEEVTDGNCDSGDTKRRRRKLVHNTGECPVNN
ncbi:MAG: hypothetical protein EBU13_10865 [Synechococcaceae bacterium WB5_2A_257]|nr:hypothetical protein [Synechococcaceae bacterium WB5_2A_257]